MGHGQPLNSGLGATGSSGAALAAVRAPSAAPALHEDAATLPVPCKSESSHPGGAEEGAKAITGLRASR